MEIVSRYTRATQCYCQYRNINRIITIEGVNVFSAGFKTHTEPLFKVCNLLKMEDIYKVRVFVFYHNLKHNNLPEYFASFNPEYSNGNSVYSFRNPNFTTPSLAHEYIKLTFRYQSPSILNHYFVYEIANTNTTEVRDIGNILINVQNIPMNIQIYN